MLENAVPGARTHDSMSTGSPTEVASAILATSTFETLSCWQCLNQHRHNRCPLVFSRERPLQNDVRTYTTSDVTAATNRLDGLFLPQWIAISCCCLFETVMQNIDSALPTRTLHRPYRKITRNLIWCESFSGCFAASPPRNGHCRKAITTFGSTVATPVQPS